MPNGPYGPHVKLTCKAGPHQSCDILVQVRDHTRISGWATVQVFNDRTVPDAHLLADATARATRVKLLEGEHVAVL